MEEILKSIKAMLYDRAVSPLFGTFVVSWAAWNYKFVLVLFSSMEIEGKLSYIKYVLYDGDKFLQIPFTDFAVSGIGIVYPLATTLAAIFLYPVFSIPVYAYVRFSARILRNIKNKYDDDELLPLHKSREIRRLALDQARDFESALGSQNDEINDLKRINSDLLQDIKNLNETVSVNDSANDSVKGATEKSSADASFSISSAPFWREPDISSGGLKLSPTQEKMLSQFCIGDRFRDDDFIIDSIGVNPTAAVRMRAKYDLDQLMENSLISTSGPFRDDKGDLYYNYVLTKKGNAYIVENNLAG